MGNSLKLTKTTENRYYLTYEVKKESRSEDIIAGVLLVTLSVLIIFLLALFQ